MLNNSNMSYVDHLRPCIINGYGNEHEYQQPNLYLGQFQYYEYNIVLYSLLLFMCAIWERFKVYKCCCHR